MFWFPVKDIKIPDIFYKILKFLGPSWASIITHKNLLDLIIWMYTAPFMLKDRYLLFNSFYYQIISFLIVRVCTLLKSALICLGKYLQAFGCRLTHPLLSHSLWFGHNTSTCCFGQCCFNLQ